MPYFKNDLTPEEQDPQNQEAIAFLKQAYVTGDTNMVAPISMEDLQSTDEVLARVRERLSAAREGPMPGFSSPQFADIVSSDGTHSRVKGISERKKRGRVSRLLVVALVAVLTLVFASPFFLFQQARFNNIMGSQQEAQSMGQTSSLSAQAHSLIEQFHEEAQRWGDEHPYHSPLIGPAPLDGKSYMLDSAYLAAGVGGELDQQLSRAKSEADFRAVIASANKAFFHLRMFEAAATDKTPYNVVHNSDIELLKQYKLQQSTVVIVSTAEQALRVYQNGKLINAILVTTGKQQTPGLIGVWTIDGRQKDATLTSAYSQDTSNWSANTPVQYALSYHAGGYFIYGAWWRATYGPGTQFPHQDASGNNNLSGLGGPNDGSPGGIEVPTQQMQRLYEQTNIGTPVIIY